MPRDLIEDGVLSGQDIICFSSIDWQFIWQGHQEIMSTLAANGNRVLFVENTGVRAPTMRDLPRLRQRVVNWWRSTKGFRRERQNLWVYSPIVLPFPYSRVGRRINRSLLTRALTRWMRAAGFGRPLVWTFLPTPLIREVIRDLDPLVSVYYCIDDFASSSAGARRVVASEAQLCREVDLVFVTSNKLREKVQPYKPSVALFPFGVSYEKFERVRDAPHAVPDDLAPLPRPIIGYVGGIHQWVDMALVSSIAAAMPEASVVMVGPVQVPADSRALAPNIHYLGKKPHDDLPQYVKAFDVGLVPYTLSEYTANVYPTKLNEYLAMGVPVVATDLPEIRRFNETHGPCVDVAADPESFAAAIRRALTPASRDVVASRIAVARRNSWRSRIQQMSALIADAIDEARARRSTWEAKLRFLYRRSRGRVAGAVVMVVLTYGAFFHTALPWELARPLWIAQPPRSADVIVVFAGGVGESGRAGGGYQERVRAAVDLYHAGHAAWLVFESGYVFAFQETEIMRDLAVSQGVPASAIILDTRGTNTYDYVLRVREVLQTRGWDSALLVSSPYHMRRALGVWRRQAPEIEVIPTPVAQSQFYAHGRGASVEQLQGLVREYLALFVYWWKGWL